MPRSAAEARTRLFRLRRYALPDGQYNGWMGWADPGFHETPDGHFITVPVYVEEE